MRPIYTSNAFGASARFKISLLNKDSPLYDYMRRATSAWLRTRARDNFPQVF